MAHSDSTLSPQLDQARQTMAEVFGYHDFRPGQAEIIDSVLKGRDVLAVMPTAITRSAQRRADGRDISPDRPHARPGQRIAGRGRERRRPDVHR
ncbi:hypothetical protein [Oceanicaulis alexandrii]|uniref:hypothetical protein n=1 Tax=Oceanicaulis alexandrii TaxID=153233 RepID=UPI0023538C71|nr:hypothetical protein [Oceanicaulis alexandrii]